MVRTTRTYGFSAEDATGHENGSIFAALALEAERVEIDKEATPALLMFGLFNTRNPTGEWVTQQARNLGL